MSDLTPETLAELRRLHIDLSPWLIGNPEDNAPCTRGELRTILDALSALLDAAAERDALAAAWDEGHQAGHEDARAVQSTYPEPTPNPYRAEGEPHA